jgi:hypothetical protein
MRRFGDENRGRVQAESSRQTKGQAAVEFALVLPVLILLTAVSLQVGRVLIHWNGMWRSANTAAELLSTGYDEGTAETMMREMLRSGMVGDGDVTITFRLEDAMGNAKCDPIGGGCEVEYGDIVVVEANKPFSVGILDYEWSEELPVTIRKKAEKGAWAP